MAQLATEPELMSAGRDLLLRRAHVRVELRVATRRLVVTIFASWTCHVRPTPHPVRDQRGVVYQLGLAWERPLTGSNRQALPLT